jgi:hypothetical protein
LPWWVWHVGLGVGLLLAGGFFLLIAQFVPFVSYLALLLNFGVLIFAVCWFYRQAYKRNVDLRILIFPVTWFFVVFVDLKRMITPFVMIWLAVVLAIGSERTVHAWRAQGEAPAPFAARPFDPPPGQGGPQPAEKPRLFTVGPEKGLLAYLADVEPFEVTDGPWPVSRGHVGNDRKDPVRVGDTLSPKGIGMHPPDFKYAAARFRLPPKAASFRAWVGINDTSSFADSAVVFEVFGDGKRLWSSRPIRLTRRVEECTTDVAGVSVLELRANCTGSHRGVHAVWVEPRVLE